MPSVAGIKKVQILNAFKEKSHHWLSTVPLQSKFKLQSNLLSIGIFLCLSSQLDMTSKDVAQTETHLIFGCII